MVSTSELILETIFPLFGCVLAFIMYVAPLKDAYTAWLKGDIGDLNPLPWVFMMGNCYGWVVYAVLMSNYYLFAANIPGLFIGIWLNLQAVKLKYLFHHEKVLREALIHALRDENARSILLGALHRQPSLIALPEGSKYSRRRRSTLITSPSHRFWTLVKQKKLYKRPPIRQDFCLLALMMAWLTITATIGFVKSFDRDMRQLIIGISVNINLVFFLGAPLSTIWIVLRTKTSVSIHVPTMLTNTASSVFWYAYGVAIRDWFVVVPNTIGISLGFVQILLRVAFRPDPTIVPTLDDLPPWRRSMEQRKSRTASKRVSFADLLNIDWGSDASSGSEGDILDAIDENIEDNDENAGNTEDAEITEDVDNEWQNEYQVRGNS